MHAVAESVLWVDADQCETQKKATQHEEHTRTHDMRRSEGHRRCTQWQSMLWVWVCDHVVCVIRVQYDIELRVVARK